MAVQVTVVVEAVDAVGTVVNYTDPIGIDSVDGTVAVSCSPSSGTVFALGISTVTCTATDAAGNSFNDSFTVTVQDTTAPVLSGIPADISIEAVDANGAVVSYTDPIATDSVDGAVAVSCAPSSGSFFLLGTSTVTCTATDASGNSSSDSFTVTVQLLGNQAPNGVIDEPVGNVTITSGEGVNFSGSGTDPENNIPLTFLWDFGGGTENQPVEDPGNVVFSTPGIFTVMLTVTDSLGSSDTTPDSLVVTVNAPIDSTPPVMSNVPSDLIVEAVIFSGAVVQFTLPTAIDAIDPNPSVSCFPAPGSQFILGVTSVICTASDTSGNTANASFMVTVQDTTLPVIGGMPGSITVEAIDDSGVIVTYSNPVATDSVDGLVLVNCLPLSGSTFPLGVTLVTCTAVDASGNLAAAAFTITVQSAPNQAPNGIINTPLVNLTITAGESVIFTGTGSDPDNHFPLTFLWDFEGGAASQTVEDPNAVIFDFPGIYTVTFTVTDNLGEADSTPDSRVITVNPDLVPTATTGPVILVTTASATLTGLGNVKGGTGSIWFEYGLTQSYGDTTVGQTVSGNDEMLVTQEISGLVPETRYYFRMCVQTLGDPICGEEATFFTRSTALGDQGNINLTVPATVARIDGYDLIVLSVAFGSDPSSLHWNPLADLNGDGIVDGRDLMILGINFGRVQE